MADDALEYATDMTDLTTKSNRKMILVGNSTQLTGLTPTYPGQIIYATTTGGAFTADVYYKRDAANTTWTAGDVTIESSEQTDIQTSGAATDVIPQNVRYYGFFTLPSTEKFYKITKVEWKNGTTVNGNITCGIELVDANPPTLASTPLLGVTQEVAQAGTSTIQSSAVVSCKPIRAGTLIGVWVCGSGATGKIFYTTGGATNDRKLITYTASPTTNDTTAWGASGVKIYCKIYFRGYL